MNFDSFHDGYFEGIRLDADKNAKIFLRTVEGARYILDLTGIEMLTLSEVREGNIIFDLVLRSAQVMTSTDLHVLYGLDVRSEKNARLLESLREKTLQILELNPSYGAEGLFLFESFKIEEV